MGLTVRTATVPAVQAFAATLATRGLAAASQARTIAAIKSLLNYADRLAFTPFNAAPRSACRGSRTGWRRAF
jgi:site-specific recombinase XerD